MSKWSTMIKFTGILLSAILVSASNEDKQHESTSSISDQVASPTGYGGNQGHGDLHAGSGRSHGGSYGQSEYGGKHGGHKYTSGHKGGNGLRKGYHGISKDRNRGHHGGNYGKNKYDDRAHADNGFKNTEGRTAYGNRRRFHDVYHDHGHQSYHKGGQGYYDDTHVKYYGGHNNRGVEYKGHNNDQGNHRSNYYNANHGKYGNGGGEYGDGGGHGSGHGSGHGGGGQGYGGYGYY